MCTELGKDTCPGNIFGWAQEKGWTDKTNYGGIVGVAKDGHVIYGPYNEEGKDWTCNQHDICNGRFFPDGSYGYVSTKQHPYLVGCYGPAP